MHPDAKIFVAGHRGQLGRALVRALRERGFARLLLLARDELDLRDARAVEARLRAERPDHVFLAAASVGGIAENQRTPADLIRDNLCIETAVIEAARLADVQSLLLFGSSCMYPREARQPISEESLWSGALEPTSRAYATAKLAGVELCRAYRAQHGCRFHVLVPATLYGPDDHFGAERAHVIPALIARFASAVRTRAAAVTLLGSGRARREFLHADDAARAALCLMEAEAPPDLVNAGSGEEVSIAELAERIARVTGFAGEIRFDAAAPDGAPRKLLDSSRIQSLGWAPRIALERGLREAHAAYTQRLAQPRFDEGGAPSLASL
jgi:GDP-L-fucose synthase